MFFTSFKIPKYTFSKEAILVGTWFYFCTVNDFCLRLQDCKYIPKKEDLKEICIDIFTKFLRFNKKKKTT